ncbi:hypothetical protein PRUPE_3G217700 [Prunus persica]|uniref:Uncharacterized protein n=1 Tax=Prunus persica TaxID=3760 RepID=M5WVE2_PRUPE|nr:hypothetical protein PRUPE_3G217700 [Prunus persica]
MMKKKMGGCGGYGFVGVGVFVCGFSVRWGRNDEEDAKEELYSLVTVTEVLPEGFTGLGTKVIDEED